MQRLKLPFGPASHPLKFPHDRIAEQPLRALLSKGLDHGA
jgi:hypothetical protein